MDTAPWNSGKGDLLNDVITTILSNWIDLIRLFHLSSAKTRAHQLETHKALVSSISNLFLALWNHFSVIVPYGAPKPIGSLGLLKWPYEIDQYSFRHRQEEEGRVKRLTTWGAFPPSHHNSSLIVAFALVFPSGKGNIRGGACRVVRKWLGWERVCSYTSVSREPTHIESRPELPKMIRVC